jgi:hypothetical protein
MQNAMSIAEITQQLGLQSLTRRAWVCFQSVVSRLTSGLDANLSLVHPIHLRYHW